MRKIGLLSLSVLLILGMALSGCQTDHPDTPIESSDAESQTAGSSGTTTAETTAPTEDIPSSVPAETTGETKTPAGTSTSRRSSATKATTAATTATKGSATAGEKPDPYQPKGLWDKYFWISTGNGHYGGTDEDLRRVIKAHKDLGFNCMERIRLSRDLLTMCEEEKMYVTTGYFGEVNADGMTRTEATTKEWAAKFADSDYFLGFIPWDEPAHDTKIFKAIHQQYEWYRKYDKTRLFMVNLLPSYGEYKWGGNAFKRYIDDFDTIADLPILGVDYYPFDTNGNCDLNSTGMWADWGYCRKLCKERNKDLWLYIQGTGWGEEGVGYWTKGRIAVQMNAAIAYGSRRVSYWVSTPLYMDDTGKPSSLYAAGKDLHRRAMTTGTYLLGKTPDKLYMSGIAKGKQGMYFLDDAEQSPLIAALPAGPTIVSTFKDNTSRTYMAVVNRSYDRTLSDSLLLKGVHSVKKLDPLTGRETAVGNTSKLSLSLEEGGMVLYIIE